MTPIEKEIEGIVDGILEDYRHGRDIDKLDPFQHPDKAVVIDMIGKLLRIVYPGSSRDKAYRIYNTKHNLSMLIEDVMYNLNKQIAIALRGDRTEREAQETAQELSLQFFRAIPGIPGGGPDRRGGLLRRRPRCVQHGRDHLLLPRTVCHHGVPAGARAVYAESPHAPAHHDGARPQRHGHRHQPRRHHRPVFLYRPRHRHCGGRDHGHRRPREGLSGRDAWRADHPATDRACGERSATPPSRTM